MPYRMPHGKLQSTDGGRANRHLDLAPECRQNASGRPWTHERPTDRPSGHGDRQNAANGR